MKSLFIHTIKFIIEKYNKESLEKPLKYDQKRWYEKLEPGDIVIAEID